MSISKEFMEAVDAGNELRTRIMLGNYMVTDPSFGEFDESLAYALKAMPDLIVPHDGEELNYDRTAWTKAYLDNQCSTVVNNFSKERIELLRNMCAHIYGKKVEETQQHKFVADAQARREKSTLPKKQVGAATAGAGVVVAAAGIAVSSTPLTIAGVVVAVAGGAIIMMDR